jgi:hypothetical protein
MDETFLQYCANAWHYQKEWFDLPMLEKDIMEKVIQWSGGIEAAAETINHGEEWYNSFIMG